MKKTNEGFTPALSLVLLPAFLLNFIRNSYNQLSKGSADKTSNSNKNARPNLVRGFTLIEILVVIGIIAILATIVIIAINPARQFAQARDAQRISNINSILNAVGQKIADNKGMFNTGGCPSLPLATTTIYNGTGGGVDLSCLTPTYIPTFPSDPTSAVGNNTGYVIRQDTNGRIWVSATTTELSIPRTTDLSVVR
ncbi:MAG: type II secretion system protein [Minisyncoccia bacterium]